MEIKPILTDADCQAALGEVERLADAVPGTPEFDRLDILATLIEAYEAKICPIAPPDPIAAVQFALERLQLSPRDLEPYIGSAERVEAVLARRHRLTLPMIHWLSNFLNILVAILAQPYELQRSAELRTSAQPTAKV